MGTAGDREGEPPLSAAFKTPATARRPLRVLNVTCTGALAVGCHKRQQRCAGQKSVANVASPKDHGTEKYIVPLSVCHMVGRGCMTLVKQVPAGMACDERTPRCMLASRPTNTTRAAWLCRRFTAPARRPHHIYLRSASHSSLLDLPAAAHRLNSTGTSLQMTASRHGED